MCVQDKSNGEFSLLLGVHLKNNNNKINEKKLDYDVYDIRLHIFVVCDGNISGTDSVKSAGMFVCII